MALTSVYYDGPVTETDRAKNLAGAPEYGVYGPGDFNVTAHPSIPYAVLVKAGRAHGHGVTDTAATDQVVQCATLASGTRWDLIVVRRNWQPALGGPSTLEVVQAGATAQIPAARKVGPGVEDDQPLFLVKWQGGTSAPVQFIDLRVWAGNGGLFAKDDFVRTYLTSLGTEVNINGVTWTLGLGTNSLPAWEKSMEVGKSPVFGVGSPILGAPAAGQGFLWQGGNLAATTDNAGFGRLTFPKPFPNGLLTVLISNADGFSTPGYTFAVAGNTPFWGSSGAGSKADVVYEVRKADGSMAVSAPHRLTYLIVGW